MLDFGFPELVLIIIVAVLVMGPRELPVVMRAAGHLVRRLQYMRFALSQQFENFMETQDSGELRRAVNFEDRADNRDFDEAAADADVTGPEPQQPQE